LSFALFRLSRGRTTDKVAIEGRNVAELRLQLTSSCSQDTAVSAWL